MYHYPQTVSRDERKKKNKMILKVHITAVHTLKIIIYIYTNLNLFNLTTQFLPQK